MNAEGWLVTQHPDGIELECPNCHDITYHDRHHRVPGWISNIIDTHQCSYPSVTDEGEQ